MTVNGARRAVRSLTVSNLFGGLGVASGFAVGALIAEALGGTVIAGFAQAASVLGSAVAAIPLAGLAVRRGRRRALTTGYAIAVVGAGVIIASVAAGRVVPFLIGLSLFGVAQAVNLQSRYAAADDAPVGSQARIISVVIWATTVGSVVGPNLISVGDRLGRSLGLPALVGSYLFSLVSFGLAWLVIRVGLRRPATIREAAPDASTPDATTPDATVAKGSLAALGWARRQPAVRFAVVLIASAHAVMVMVMVMTPLHMQHHGMSLEFVGVVISLHVVGMYALSPVFGWLTDRVGAIPISVLGVVTLLGAVALGFAAAAGHPDGNSVLTTVALVLLGLGWSACLIAASALLTSTTPEHVRVPLQGATDAAMSYAGALAAVVAGPLLAVGGFRLVNTAGALLLIPAVLCLVPARVAGSGPGRRSGQPARG